MNGQQYFTQPDGQGIVFPEEVGVSDLSKGESPTRPITGTPVTSRFRRIGNPSPNAGLWNDIKTWWTGLKPEYRYGIFAASQKGTSSIGKI